MSIQRTPSCIVTCTLLAASLLSAISHVTIKPSFANPSPPRPNLIANDFYERRGVMKFKLEDAGISVGSVLFWGAIGFVGSKGADWVRLELDGNRVRIIHTTRTKNWVTQIQKWWDHPVKNIIFKPNSCTSTASSSDSGSLEEKLQEYQSLYDRQLISEAEYNQLRQSALRSAADDSSSAANTSNSDDCLVYGTDDVVELPEGTSVLQGEFKIEYQESGEWKTVLFSVPSGTPITER